MSDSHTLPIQAASRVAGAAPVQPVRPEHAHGTHAEPKPESSPAATTGGTLRAAYAQFMVDPDTDEVVVRIRDASTDEVISELPSKEVQAVTRHLRAYAEALARHRAALNSGSGN
jgi:hypothetical protein